MAPRANTHSHPFSSGHSRSPRALNHPSSVPEFLTTQASFGCAFFSFLPPPLLFYLLVINPCGLPGGFTEECDCRNVYCDIYAIPVGCVHLHYQSESSGRATDGVIMIMDGVYWAYKDMPSSAVHNLFNTRLDEKFQRHTNQCLLKELMSRAA